MFHTYVTNHPKVSLKRDEEYYGTSTAGTGVSRFTFGHTPSLPVINKTYPDQKYGM